MIAIKEIRCVDIGKGEIGLQLDDGKVIQFVGIDHLEGYKLTSIKPNGVTLLMSFKNLEYKLQAINHNFYFTLKKGNDIIEEEFIM